MRNVMILSRDTHTPIPYWTGIPLRQLPLWVRTFNALRKEETNG